MSAPPDVSVLPPAVCTQKLAWIAPSFEGKKNCTDELACKSVSARGSSELESVLPAALEANVLVKRSMLILLCTGLSEAGRSGVTQ